MSVNQAWVDGLLKMKHAEQVTALRAKSAELYRAKHGRDPKDADERNAGLQLVTEATERLRSQPNAKSDVDAVLRAIGLGPMTIGERRAMFEEEDRKIRRAYPEW